MKVEINNRPFAGELGARVTILDDGPLAAANNDNIDAGLKVYEWPVMRRATSGTLMVFPSENKMAAQTLQRGRDLFDAAWRNDLALQSLYDDSGTYSQRWDRSVDSFDIYDLNGSKHQLDPPYQTDTRARFGPKYAKRLDQLARMTDDEYRVLGDRKALDLHKYRYDFPRGTNGKHYRDPRPDCLGGKVKPKYQKPAFNSQFNSTEQYARVEAKVELELLQDLMGQHHFDVFTSAAWTGLSITKIGEAAGFSAKQAEAVGLDRVRSAIEVAKSNFATIDAIEAAAPHDWIDQLPPDTLLPARVLSKYAA